MTQYQGPYPPAGGPQPPYPPPPGGPQAGPPPYAPPQPPVAPPPRGPVDAGPPPPAGSPQGAWSAPPPQPYGAAPQSPPPSQPVPPPYGGPPPGPWTPGAPVAPPRRRRTGLIVGIVVGVVVLAGVIVGAVLLLGSSTIDPAKAADAITQGTQKQFGVAPTGVHCPSDVAVKAGSTFTCTAKLDGQAITYTLKQTDDKGNVDWHSDSNIAPVSQLEDAVAKQVGDQAGVTAKASCDAGGHKVIVGATSTPIPCTVTNASDPTDSVNVKASLDAQGHVTVEQAG